MSEGFLRARNYTEEQRRKGSADALIQDRMPEFKDGAFNVNRFVPSNPPLYGMQTKDLKLNLDQQTLTLIEKFAKRRGLVTKTSGDNVYLINRREENVALLKPGMFAAAEPELFEDIGKVLYKVSPDLQSELELAEGWQGALARLLADRSLWDKIILLLFIVFSPIFLAAVSLFASPSIFFPREILIVLGIIGIVFLLWWVRLYFRENYPKR